MILHDIHAERINLGESFQVAAIVEKLHVASKDFKEIPKQANRMNNVPLIVKFWIKEDNQSLEKKGFNHVVTKANVVEHGQHYNT